MPVRTIRFFLVARLSGAFRFSFCRKVKGAGCTGYIYRGKYILITVMISLSFLNSGIQSYDTDNLITP